jgi:hypothetical protein
MEKAFIEPCQINSMMANRLTPMEERKVWRMELLKAAQCKVVSSTLLELRDVVGCFLQPQETKTPFKRWQLAETDHQVRRNQAKSSSTKVARPTP